MAILQLLMLQGPPASGKTVHANSLVGSGIFNTVISAENIKNSLPEKDRGRLSVIKERDRLIESSLSKGLSVILDDYNIDPQIEESMRGLAQKYHALFSIERLHTSLEECIDRDQKRPEGKRVGADKISGIFKQFEAIPEVVPYRPNIKQRSTALVSIESLTRPDGKLNEELRFILSNLCRSMAWECVYICDSEVKDRKMVEQALFDAVLPTGDVHLRPLDDKRPTWQVRMDAFDKYVRTKKYVRFAVENDPNLAKLWRKMEIPILTLT